MTDRVAPERMTSRAGAALVSVSTRSGAEGVETDNQLTFLHALGCQIGQGYLFSKPVRAPDFVKLLTGNRKVFLAAERA